MAAVSAAAAAADPSSTVTITFTDRSHLNMMGKVTQTFPLDTTWLQVAEALVSQRPRASGTTWTILTREPEDSEIVETFLVVGIDIPLGEQLGVRADKLRMESLAAQSLFSACVPYEEIGWAIAAARANLTWPLWDAKDTDIFNGEAMGAFDDWRRRRGATIVPRAQNNDLPNLIGLTNASGIIRCCNRYQLLQFILTKVQELFSGHAPEVLSIRDPFFGMQLPVALDVHNQIMTEKRILPVLNLDTSTFTFPYADAKKEYYAWLETVDGQEAQKKEETAHQNSFKYMMITSQAYSVLRDGGSKAQAVAILQSAMAADPERLAVETDKLTAYIQGLESNKERSLVDVFIAKYRAHPSCSYTVFQGTVDELVRRFPGHWPADAQAAVKKLSDALEFVRTKHMYENTLAEDHSARRAQQEEEINTLLARSDWETVPLSQVIPNMDAQKTNPHGIWAASDYYYTLLNAQSDDDEDDRHTKQAQKRAMDRHDAIKAAARALLNCTCAFPGGKCEKMAAQA